jgi:hypothetical protein
MWTIVIVLIGVEVTRLVTFSSTACIHCRHESGIRAHVWTSVRPESNGSKHAEGPKA